MNTQGLQIGARLNEARKLREERDALKQENSRLRDELECLTANLEFAQTVMSDLKAEGCRLVLVDGWNLILGAQRKFADREELMAHYREELAKDGNLRVWIVLDGPKANTMCEGRLRVSYTGGTGGQRADRFIRKVAAAARFLGLGDKVTIHTFDKELRK